MNINQLVIAGADKPEISPDTFIEDPAVWCKGLQHNREERQPRTLIKKNILKPGSSLFMPNALAFTIECWPW